MTTTKNADIILKAIRSAVEQDSNMQVTARMSRGSKSAAMALVKEVVKHYIRDETLLNNADDFEWAFDTAYAEPTHCCLMTSKSKVKSFSLELTCENAAFWRLCIIYSLSGGSLPARHQQTKERIKQI